MRTCTVLFILLLQPPVREKVMRRHVRVLVNLLARNVHQDLFNQCKRCRPQRRQLEEPAPVVIVEDDARDNAVKQVTGVVEVQEALLLRS